MKRATILVACLATAAVIVMFTTRAGAASSSDSTSFAVTPGPLSFSSAPAVPTLPSMTLNGQAQTTNTAMTNFAVMDTTGSGSGWNVTVSGDARTGKSAVFKQYCPETTCGTDNGPGYVTDGQTLLANSLTLNSTGASVSAQDGTAGAASWLPCSSACNVDSATASKIASAPAGAGMGTWAMNGWSGTSLALATPSTVKVLPANEVYRVDLVWSLGSGP